MKIVTEQQKDAAARAAAVGASKGAALGLAAFIPAFYALGLRFPAVRNLPPVQKGYLGLVAALGAGATNAEFAYEDFIKSEWQGPSADRLHEQERTEHDEWVSMSPKERLLRWTLKHKYQVVFGSWVASMGLSAAFIFARNPTQTFSQKLVQCRMVAQGATVAVLIASAGLSRVSFEDDAPAETRPEEQWRQMIEVPQQKAPPLGSVHPSHSHKQSADA